MTAEELDRMLGPIALSLHRIAEAMERLSPPTPEPRPELTTACLHPLDSRTDFGMTNGEPDWQCRICQFRSQQ